MIHLTDNLVAVLVPEDAYDFGINKPNDVMDYLMLFADRPKESGSSGFCVELDDSFEYEIVGLIDSFGKFNFDCEKYVEKVDIKTDLWDKKPYYKNYCAREGYCDLVVYPNYDGSYKDSFLSLLRSKSISLKKLNNQKLLILEKL